MYPLSLAHFPDPALRLDPVFSENKPRPHSRVFFLLLAGTFVSDTNLCGPRNVHKIVKRRISLPLSAPIFLTNTSQFIPRVSAAGI